MIESSQMYFGRLPTTPPFIQLRTTPTKSYVSPQSDMRNGITATRTRLLPHPALRHPPSRRQFTRRQNLIKRPFRSGVLAPQLFSTRFHPFAPKNLRCTSVLETITQDSDCTSSTEPVVYSPTRTSPALSKFENGVEILIDPHHSRAFSNF